METSSGNSHVSEFSPDGKLFALINPQGVLNIWDTETSELKQEFIPNLHLSSPCTSLTWILVNSQPQKRKKRKFLGNSESEQLYLAFGTSKGGVAIYSYASGKIERNLKGDGHAARVTGITTDKNDSIFTCGDDCFVIVWSISAEKQVNSWKIGNEKPNSVVYLPETNSLLIGARQIKQYSISSQELLQTFTGHTSDIILLKQVIHENEEYAISASRLERNLSLWKIGKGKKYKNALSTLLIEDIAIGMSCKVDSENNLMVAAVTRSGVVHFYLKSLDSLQPNKPIRPKVTVLIATDVNTVQPIPAIAASVQFGKSSEEVLVGYGEKQFISFESITPNFSEKRQVLVRNECKKQFGKQKNDESQLKLNTPIVMENDVEYKAGAALSRKHSKTVETPMETRLENLSLSKGEAPQAQSKIQLLIQALHSKDSNLLRTVLSNNDIKVIQLTLQKLPVQYVPRLVEELTSLMQKKRAHVQTAGIWLKVLIKTHTSQLMALGPDELMNRFGPCLGIIEHRMNCLKNVARLTGRLELLVSQIKRNTDEEAVFNNDNVIIYEDEASSNSDLNENKAQESSSSDNEWSEEESAEEMDVSDKEN